MTGPLVGAGRRRLFSDLARAAAREAIETEIEVAINEYVPVEDAAVADQAHVAWAR
jgi:hypothetical protein